MKKKLARAISGRVKALRDRAALSQQELATRANLSLSLVAKIEQGKKADPRASTLLALAEALGVQPGELLDNLPLRKPEPEVPHLEAVERNGSHPAEAAAPARDGEEEDGARKKGKGKKKSKKKKAKKEA